MARSRLIKISVVALHAAVVLLLSSAEARAQGFVSPLIGYDFGGDSHCPDINDCQDKNLNVAVGFGAMGTVFGFEAEAAVANDFFGSAPDLSSNVVTLMGNVMIVPDFGPVRPYVLAGAGLIKSHVELTPGDIITSDNNHAGWDVGGGLMIFFSDHVGVRGDLRYFHAFQNFEHLGLTLDSDKLDYGRAGGGLVFKF